MDNYPSECNPEKINKIKNALDKLTKELDLIETLDNAELRKCFVDANKEIDFLCLMVLGLNNRDADILSANLRPAAAQLGNGSRKTAQKMNKYIKRFLYYLEEGSEPEPEPDPEPEPLFPYHKYLNLRSKAEFPHVKAQYKKLALLYHPDICKIEGWTKEQCATEFKILSNEYEAIKQKLNVSGGKKSNKNSNTKKLHNIKRKHKSKSKRIRKRIRKSKKN